jgi:hypothetical protein
VFLPIICLSLEVFSQPLKMPASVKRLPGGSCYWGYSVHREKTTGDSTHLYKIYLDCYQSDSTGRPSGRVEIHGAKLSLEYQDRGNQSKIAKFHREGNYFVSTFKVHTNQHLYCVIHAEYNGQKREMDFLINTGIYPGEPQECEDDEYEDVSSIN